MRRHEKGPAAHPEANPTMQRRPRRRGARRRGSDLLPRRAHRRRGMDGSSLQLHASLHQQPGSPWPPRGAWPVHELAARVGHEHRVLPLRDHDLHRCRRAQGPAKLAPLLAMPSIPSWSGFICAASRRSGFARTCAGSSGEDETSRPQMLEQQPAYIIKMRAKPGASD